MSITLDELVVADSADSWRQAGFTVDDDAACRVGDVRIRVVGRDRGTGIVGWVLGGLPRASGDLDGVPTSRTDVTPPAAATHLNGVTEIDHVVLMSPDLARTVNAFAAVGIEPRRQRDAELGGRPIRQIFCRFGAVIVEVVGSPDAAGDGPSTLWGITFTVADIDVSAAFFGDRTTPVKAAVQTGRRITTLRHRDLGMSVPTALISAPILGA